MSLRENLLERGIAFVLSHMTGCRLVSLFDTRVKFDDDAMEMEDASTRNDNERLEETWEDVIILDTDDEVDPNKIEKPGPRRSEQQPKRVLEKVDEYTEEGTNSDTSKVQSKFSKDE
jgi:hypothetical protein